MLQGCNLCPSRKVVGPNKMARTQAGGPDADSETCGAETVRRRVLGEYLCWYFRRSAIETVRRYFCNQFSDEPMVVQLRSRNAVDGGVSVEERGVAQ